MIKRAYSFETAFCESSECGLHLLAKDADDKVICEIVMSAKQTLAVIEICKGFLYDKATKRSE